MNRPCHDCLHNEHILVEAQYSAPIQKTEGFAWIAVCPDHAMGWYEGADFGPADAPIRHVIE